MINSITTSLSNPQRKNLPLQISSGRKWPVQLERVVSEGNIDQAHQSKYEHLSQVCHRPLRNSFNPSGNLREALLHVHWIMGKPWETLHLRHHLNQNLTVTLRQVHWIWLCWQCKMKQIVNIRMILMYIFSHRHMIRVFREKDSDFNFSSETFGVQTVSFNVMRSTIRLHNLSENVFLWSKLYFQHHYSSLQCHMIFRNHFNMLLKKHFWLLSMFKAVLLLWYFCRNWSILFFRIFDE